MTDDSNNHSRQTAQRALAGEVLAATESFKESDEDRAPVYNLLPTGEKANRVFVVGTLVETEDVGSDSEYWKGEIVGPTGDKFYVYAGQYQQEAMGKLRSLAAPAYLAVVAKLKTYETDDGDINVSLTPESITEVDAETRDQWVIETVEATLDRIEAFRSEEQTPYQEMAAEAYGENVEEYLEAAIEALANVESVVDEVDTSEADAGADAAAAD